jgi:hypothetical protein
VEVGVEQTYSSSHKGVVWISGKLTNPWRALFKQDGRTVYLGYYATEEAAAAAITAYRVSHPKQTPGRRRVSAIGCYDDDRSWVVVELTQGKWAKVDLADLDLVIGQCWDFSSGYATRSEGGRRIRMHRIILGLADDEPLQVDHVNHDPIDNRRINLRLATQSQNNANMRKSTTRSTASRYKGVLWNKERKKWCARITVHGHYRYLGLFDAEEEAARAYNRAALEAWGEFAHLNEIPIIRRGATIRR